MKLQRRHFISACAAAAAVPAMPVGPPGMGGPEYGGRRDPYDVLLVAKGGRSSVFQTYR